MPNSLKWFGAVIFLVLIGLILLWSFPKKRKQIMLSDGYRLARIYGDAQALIGPQGNGIILPNIVDAIDNKTHIIGLRLKAKPLDAVFSSQQYGYFIYYKQSNGLRLGLSSEQLKAILVKENISLRLETMNQ